MEAFRSAFAEVGHTCLEAPGCDWAEGLLNRPADDHLAWRQRTWECALRWLSAEHRKQPIDLFIAYLYPGQIDTSALSQVRDLGIPCVNFFCDNVRLFRSVPSEFRGFDLHWVPEVKGCDLYTRARLPHLFAPMPCWVDPRLRSLPQHESLPPAFVGTRDEQRERLFSEAIKLGLSIQLRGRGWIGTPGSENAPPRGGGAGIIANQVEFIRSHGLRAFMRKIGSMASKARPVEFDFSPWAGSACDGESYWQVLRESVVCVGVNRYPSFRFPADRPDTYSRLRDLEAPMVGSAYLTEAAPELPLLYEVGEEVEVYSSPAELVDKARDLVGDREKRLRMRTRAQRRALADHSIERTISRIGEHLGLFA